VSKYQIAFGMYGQGLAKERGRSRENTVQVLVALVLSRANHTLLFLKLVFVVEMLKRV
jgi:hypothetical protein